MMKGREIPDGPHNGSTLALTQRKILEARKDLGWEKVFLETSEAGS